MANYSARIGSRLVVRRALQEQFVFSIPPPGPDGKPFEMPPEPPSKAYVVDAADFVSQQSFAPWPLPQDPKANCAE